MTTLPELLNFVVTTLQVYPACTHVQVMETCIFTTDQFFCKIRADFGKNLSFQARIYYNRGHCDYAYQVFILNTAINLTFAGWQWNTDWYGFDGLARIIYKKSVKIR